jgi:hypothetical protein
MTSPKKNQEPLSTYAEAMRYVENAKECLKKAGKEGSTYNEKKYVRMAGNTLWNGVLVSLEARFPYKGRPDIRKYREAVAKLNKSKLKTLNVAYELIHLHMGYDGTLWVPTSRDGIKLAVELIEWAAPD